jgi:hypothetical protein
VGEHRQLTLEAVGDVGLVATGKQGHERRVGLADVLALVDIRVADHHDRDVRVGGDGSGACDVAAVVVRDVSGRLPQSVQHCRALEVPHIARAAVTDVHRVGQSADHCDPLRGRDRQHGCALHRLVAQQEDGAARGLAGEGSVFGRAEHGGRRRRRGQDVVEAQQRGDHSLHRAVDVGTRHVAALERRREMLLANHPVRHLDVEPCLHRGRGIAQAQDPVADDVALEAPLGAQHVGEQLVALAAPLAVHTVVGGHHRRRTFVDHSLEVGKEHLVQRDVVHLHVHAEPGVLHRVAGEVLHARHHVPLQAAGERGAELPDVERVLP